MSQLMNRRNFLLSSLVMLGGCGGVWNLPSHDDLPPDKSGVVIASVGGAWTGGPRYSVRFRPIASPTTVGELVFRRSWFDLDPVDIQENSAYATVATRRLPPGMYEIYGAMVFYGTGLGQISYFDKRPFSFPFEIFPGKATYLGEFLGRPVRGESDAVGTIFTVRDRRARDLALLRKRGIEFQENSVVSAVMNKNQSANSIFRRLDDAP